jgi:hypothetical protein
MAVLVAQSVVRAGVKPVYVAAAEAGDSFANTGDEFIHIKNGAGDPYVVTIATPATVDGLAVADRTVSIPAGEERMIGPFPSNTYNDSTGKVQLTYDGIVSVTIAIIKLG